MGDFPAQWKHIRDLSEGGQGHTFVVERSDGSDARQYVLKRLKNPKREEYFDREIKACESLDHPNVLRVIEHGRTPNAKLYLITEYCAPGSLESRARFTEPGPGLRFFEQIVAGVAYAHDRSQPIYHLDIKPENIMLRGATPVIGDFGICFIEDGKLSLTSEGPRGSMYYCAPELRGPKIQSGLNLAAADVYSLGKVLYWLFTHEVYDGNEDEYSNDATRRLATLYKDRPQFSFIDDLVAVTVKRVPSERIQSASELLRIVRRISERIEAGGRVLNTNIPQRCLYCAEGTYRTISGGFYPPNPGPKVPTIDQRRVQENPQYPEHSMYANMREAARAFLGTGNAGIPLILCCDYCGNVQYFRWDQTPDGHGENWRP
jgi:serine/threonine protein kinase